MPSPEHLSQNYCNQATAAIAVGFQLTMQITCPGCSSVVYDLEESLRYHPDRYDGCCGIQEHCICSQVQLGPSAIGAGACKPIAGSWGDAQDWHLRKHWPEACSGYSRHLQEPDTAASTGSAGSLHVPAKPTLCSGWLRLCAAGPCCLQVTQLGFQIHQKAKHLPCHLLDVNLQLQPQADRLEMSIGATRLFQA